MVDPVTQGGIGPNPSGHRSTVHFLINQTSFGCFLVCSLSQIRKQRRPLRRSPTRETPSSLPMNTCVGIPFARLTVLWKGLVSDTFARPPTSKSARHGDAGNGARAWDTTPLVNIARNGRGHTESDTGTLFTGRMGGSYTRQGRIVRIPFITLSFYFPPPFFLPSVLSSFLSPPLFTLSSRFFSSPFAPFFRPSPSSPRLASASSASGGAYTGRFSHCWSCPNVKTEHVPKITRLLERPTASTTSLRDLLPLATTSCGKLAPARMAAELPLKKQIDLHNSRDLTPLDATALFHEAWLRPAAATFFFDSRSTSSPSGRPRRCAASSSLTARASPTLRQTPRLIAARPR